MEKILISAAQATLLTAYEEVMGNADVRELMKNLVQDPDEETVDVKKSAATIEEIVTSDPKKWLNEPRREIINWLRNLYYSGVAKNATPEWWWEMSYRVLKVVTISIILEKENLKSFGATPTASDIPIPIQRICIILQDIHKEKGVRKENGELVTFDALKKKFIQDVYDNQYLNKLYPLAP